MLASEKQHDRPPAPHSRNNNKRQSLQDMRAGSASPAKVPLPPDSPDSSRVSSDMPSLALLDDEERPADLDDIFKEAIRVAMQPEGQAKAENAEINEAAKVIQRLFAESATFKTKPGPFGRNHRERVLSSVSHDSDFPGLEQFLKSFSDGGGAGTLGASQGEMFQVSEGDIIIGDQHQSFSSGSDESASSSPDLSNPAERAHRADWSLSSSKSHPDVVRMPSTAPSDPLQVLQSLNHDLHERLEQALEEETARRKALNKANHKIEALKRGLDQARQREHEQLEQRTSKSSTTSSATLATGSDENQHELSEMLEGTPSKTSEWPVSGPGKPRQQQLVTILDLKSQKPTQDSDPFIVSPVSNDLQSEEAGDDSFGNSVLDNAKTHSQLLYGELAPTLALNQRVRELEVANKQVVEANEFLRGQVEMLQEAYLSVEQFLRVPSVDSDEESDEDELEVEEGMCGTSSQGVERPSNPLGASTTSKASGRSNKQHPYSPNRPSRLSTTMNYSSGSDKTAAEVVAEEEEDFDFTESFGNPMLGCSLASELGEEPTQLLTQDGSQEVGTSKTATDVSRISQESPLADTSDPSFHFSKGSKESPRPSRKSPQPKPLSTISERRSAKSGGLAVPGSDWDNLSSGRRPLRSPTEELDQRLTDFAAGFKTPRAVDEDTCSEAEGNELFRFAFSSRLHVRLGRGGDRFIGWAQGLLAWTWLWMHFGMLMFIAVVYSLWQGPTMLQQPEQPRIQEESATPEEERQEPIRA